MPPDLTARLRLPRFAGAISRAETSRLRPGVPRAACGLCCRPPRRQTHCVFFCLEEDREEAWKPSWLDRDRRVALPPGNPRPRAGPALESGSHERKRPRRTARGSLVRGGELAALPGPDCNPRANPGDSRALTTERGCWVSPRNLARPRSGPGPTARRAGPRGSIQRRHTPRRCRYTRSPAAPRRRTPSSWRS